MSVASSPSTPHRSRALLVPALRWGLAIAVFLWLGARHWPETVDDTVISINYARQWAEGHGLTWTTGERVEGYSNFLLVALLAAGIRLGADAALLAQGISVAAVAGTLGVVSARLPRTATATAALLALAALGSLDFWGMLGLEGPLFGLLLGLGWAQVASGAFGSGVALLALASVTRPEGPLYLGLAVLARAQGPRRWSAGDGLATASLALVLTYHATRIAWYGAFWPTPYLVKVVSVPWTRYGFAQVIGDLALVTPVLGALALSTRLSSRQTIIASTPLVAQSLLLWRASGDWMTHGRLILPGLIATAITWASLGATRQPSTIRAAIGLVLAVVAGVWMPTGYGQITWTNRPLPSLHEVEHALTRGLDTPLSEDVVWAARNVPAGDRVMAIDAGMLGAIPELLLIDSRGLVHRGFAEAAAARAEEPYMRALVSDPATCPEWMRIANWEGAALPDLPDWLTTRYTLREEIRYGSSRIGWYATHDRRALPETGRRRLDALHAAYPSYPLLTWHAALLHAEAGDLEGAMAIAAEGRQRWPHDPRFSDAPGSLSFPSGPFGLDQVQGRGAGLYWNGELRSRPISPDEIQTTRLRLDVDAPGADGATASVTWQTPCGLTSSTLTVRGPALVAPPPCDAKGDTRVQVAFTNDSSGPEGDRNLYATLVGADDH